MRQQRSSGAAQAVAVIVAAAAAQQEQEQRAMAHEASSDVKVAVIHAIDGYVIGQRVAMERAQTQGLVSSIIEGSENRATLVHPVDVAVETFLTALAQDGYELRRIES